MHGFAKDEIIIDCFMKHGVLSNVVHIVRIFYYTVVQIKKN